MNISNDDLARITGLPIAEMARDAGRAVETHDGGFGPPYEAWSDLPCHTLALIEALRALAEASRWRDAAEEPPHDDRRPLLIRRRTIDGQTVNEGWYAGGGRFGMWGLRGLLDPGDVVQWMPMPEPPR